MLDRGIRHLPVLSPTGAVLGVIEDADLMAAVTQSSFRLRRALARAETVEEVATAAAGLRPALIELHAARVPPGEVSAIQSVVLDAVCRRLLEIFVAEGGAPPVPLRVVRARQRRTAGGGAVLRRRQRADLVRRRQGAGGGAARACRAGVSTASEPAASRRTPTARWLPARSSPARSRTGEQPPAAGSRSPRRRRRSCSSRWRLTGAPSGASARGLSVPDAFQDARRHPELLRLLARFALSFRPPTGFLRDFVVEFGGEHRGQLDIKHGGVVPIVDLARWAGMVAGVTSGSTRARLRAAADAGTLRTDDAQRLAEAFELICSVRLSHQVEQLQAGEEPDDFIHPRSLSPVARGALKEAFRSVSSVQRHIASELQLGLR